MRIVVEFVVLSLLLTLTALTAGSEISIIAASRIRLRKLASEGSRSARIALKIVEMPERFFGTILVTNNVVNSLVAVLITAVTIRVSGGGEWSLVVATLVASFLIIVCEVTAKTVAARHSERLALLLARPMNALIRISLPLVRGFEMIVNMLTNIFGGKATGKQSLLTEEEIKALIKIGEQEGVLHKEKVKMLSKVFDFSEAVVRTVMTAKKEIVAINVDSKLDDILDEVVESGYSRLPVYRGSPDNIVGIINMKDLLILSYNKDLIVMQDLMYPATFISGGKKVTELLKEFQKGHTHLAIVTDDRGAIEGIVTLEDLIEEIVGEIEDEHDVRASNYKTKRML